MNVYDRAHALARSLRKSPSYQRLLTAEKTLAKKPEKLDRMKEARKRQMELAAKELKGEEIAPETMDAWQTMMKALLADEEIQEYLAAEERFGQQLADVQKILGEVLADLTLLKGDKGEGV